MKTTIQCQYRTEISCRLYRRPCHRDLSPDHFPNNLDCEDFKPIRIYVIEVKESKPTQIERFKRRYPKWATANNTNATQGGRA